MTQDVVASQLLLCPMCGFDYFHKGQTFLERRYV